MWGRRTDCKAAVYDRVVGACAYNRASEALASVRRPMLDLDAHRRSRHASVAFMTMAVVRIVPYADGGDIPSSREFYVGVLGLEVTMDDPVLGLCSPVNRSAQIVIGEPGVEDPQPRFGVDVGYPEAVDAAHAEALRRGLRVVYPLTDEPWGIRRFVVEDPGGTVVSVLAHLAGPESYG